MVQEKNSTKTPRSAPVSKKLVIRVMSLQKKETLQEKKGEVVGSSLPKKKKVVESQSKKIEATVSTTSTKKKSSTNSKPGSKNKGKSAISRLIELSESSDGVTSNQTGTVVALLQGEIGTSIDKKLMHHIQVKKGVKLDKTTIRFGGHRLRIDSGALVDCNKNNEVVCDEIETNYVCIKDNKHLVDGNDPSRIIYTP